jgi:ABC-type Fe3+-siderophore transport system permease subunit
VGLDVRLPLGLLFFAIGALLAFYGLSTMGSDIYAKSMGVDLNLIWGSILALVGLITAWIGRKPK